MMMIKIEHILLICVCIVIFIVAIRLFYAPIYAAKINPPAFSYDFSYLNPINGKYIPFPSIYDDDDNNDNIHVSLVVPAYNEENRLHEMMQETIEFFEKRVRRDSSLTYEIIIVNDGSTDRTDSVALEYAKRCSVDRVRLLNLKVNQGKGGAVQQGMLHSRGKYILMVDADGATNIHDFEKLESKLKKLERNGYGVAVGSRAHLAERAVAQRKWYRNILMYGFHFVVYVFAVRTIKDTQCGFKLFTRKSAQILFANQHLRRWSFDVELLHMTERLKWPLVEVGVRWEEIPGSKLNLLESSILMGRDLLVIFMCFTFGIWKLNSNIQHIKKAALNKVAL